MSDEKSPNILDDYFDCKECAAALNVAPITLSRWRMQKIGPPVTYMGRTILYKKSSVRAWLAAQERTLEHPSLNRKSATA